VFCSSLVHWSYESLCFGAGSLERRGRTWVVFGQPNAESHRMFGVGRALCGSSGPTLLPKQGHPEQAAQGLVQAGLEYLQRRRLHSPSGQPGPGLRHPQREEVLPRVQLELPVLQFVSIAPCPVAKFVGLGAALLHCPFPRGCEVGHRAPSGPPLGAKRFEAFTV